MYEFELINPKITKQYAESMHHLLKSENPYLAVFNVIQKAMKSLVPNTAHYLIKPHIKNVLQPLYKMIESKYNLRKFHSLDEAREIYHNNLLHTNEEKDEEIFEVQDMIYDLLEYDACIEENGQLFLHSLSSLYHMIIKHASAIEDWQMLKENKINEYNFDIALNTNKSLKKMLAFKKNSIDLELAHPYVDDRESLELQKQIVLDFPKYNHITARFVHDLKRLKDELPNDVFVQSHAKLAHVIDADRPIDIIEIYQSFFTSIVGIYKKSSKINDKELPYTKIYKFAQKLTMVIFPELKKLKKPLFVYDKIKKPIKEVAILNGFRLISFEDNRYKIKKEQFEIDITEQYLKNIIKFSKKYTYTLSKS